MSTKLNKQRKLKEDFDRILNKTSKMFNTSQDKMSSIDLAHVVLELRQAKVITYSESQDIMNIITVSAFEKSATVLKNIRQYLKIEID